MLTFYQDGDGESDSARKNPSALIGFSPPAGNEELSTQIQSMTIRQGSPQILPPGSPNVNNGRQTPTFSDYSTLLANTAIMKANQLFQSEFASATDEVPLESIPFFRFLSEDVQRYLEYS